MELLSNEFLFFCGIILASVGVIAIISLFILSTVGKKRLTKTLEKEYGEKEKKTSPDKL